MTFINRLTFFLIGCLFLCSCGSKNELEIASRNFESEIELQQNLVFLFNKDIFADSLLGIWDSTTYINFSPAVKGKFKWNTKSELVFSPKEGFAPGAEYEGKLTNSLLKYSAKKYSFSSKPFTFHTAPLQVNSTHLLWTRGKNANNVLVQLDLGFNYDINLDEAAARLKLSSNGNPVNMLAVNTGMGKVLSVQFMPVNDKDAETPLKISIGKGIMVTGTKYVSKSDTAFETVIPSRYNLSITDITAQHNGTEGVITVSTSQPPEELNIKSLVTIAPAVPFEIAVSEGGFSITSAQFSATQAYQVNISQKLEGIFGGKLKQEYTGQVSFGKLKPAITFINTKGMYLSSAGNKNISLSIVNVPDVEVSIIKIYENNLEHFMRKGKENEYHWDSDDDDGSNYEYYDTENMGDIVFNKTYETAKLPKLSESRILNIDFRDKIKSYNGIYVVRVQSKQQNWVQDSKILSISDIGLIVKEEKNNVYVFANSIGKAEPLAGVSVSFISTNNQVLSTVTTDNEGIAVLKNIDATAPGFKVGMVTAKRNDEFTFVWLQNCMIGTSRFDVGGRIPNDAGLNAMIYGERNLYRPGETVHLTTVVRDERWKNPGEVPVKIKLIMPNGKEFSTVRKILNEEGSCEVAFPIPVTALTGTYTANVFTGNDVLLNTYSVSIEEFMPDRMKASLKINKEEYKPGEKITAAIQADNLFGTPAADRNYECELNMEKTVFTAKNYPDYDFSLSNEYRFTPDLRTGKTDAKGSATQEFTLDNMTNSGQLSGNITATVFDETGRPLHRYTHFTVFTQPVFIGIKNSEQYVSTNTPVRVNLVATDKNGSPGSVNATVTLLEKQWHTVIQQNGNGYRYVSQPENRIVSQQKLRISGVNTAYIANLQQSGEYEVRVFIDGSENYVSKRLYAWGWGDSHYTSFEVDNEGNVDIKPDKPVYNQGDNMNILLTTPFDGRMLVTVERDHIFKHYYLDVKNKSASLSLKAEEDHIPNVYITATLFRPMNGGDMPLTVAHGFQSVKVENKSYKLPVTLSIAEKSRSATKQSINVKTVPGAFVTIAAVDEGILQVKNYVTPDLYGYFYQKTALAVHSYDIYPWLLPEIKTTLSSTGGDGNDQSNMRVNPVFANRVKLVSFWSGIRQADGSGNVTFDINVPQFSGDLRIMAAAYKGKAFGSTDNHMKVVDPMVISVALPRFLSPKDEVVVPVSISNTTAKNAGATVTIQVSGPLGITGGTTQVVNIPAGREQRAVFYVTAMPATGVGKVTVTVKALGETFTNETEIGVRPPASLQKLTGSGLATANNNTAIDLASAFIPSSVSGKIVIGKSPLTQFSKNISYLVQYPYGCVEQTTSAAFPQLYYADLVKSITGFTDKNINPSYNVQQAINKLQSMQLNNGALSYWPQGGYESWWGTVYATHFILEAKKAGYEVSENALVRLLQYLKFKLNKKETETFFYNGDKTKLIAPEEVAYSLYVLARAGQTQQATMNYYKAHQELLTLDSKYLLSAAYSLAGQPLQAKEVLPPAFAGEIPNHSFDGSFYSYIRDEALALNVLMDVDPGNRQVGVMTQHLTEQLKKERYLSTQENAFSMLALGKVAKMANKTAATAAIIYNGKKVATTDGAPVTLNAKDYAGNKLNIQVNGTGGYFYSWEIDGITADGSYKQEDSYLKVRRTFYNRDGNEISSNTFKQNDLVVVRISISAEYRGDIQNVAITDMLPAGFEIENTRLNEMPAMKWIIQQDEPEYKDIRDDRINFFTTVSGRQRNFYYMVRAVSPGTFRLGPVQADAMYDGNYHSYNGAGIIKIN
ncbi:MAG: alpha-2-macroglobulin family protein [Taibaiella sp.]|nr:alpha-2-macroglobulin family protein [Taibaiella sp.]